MRGTNVGMIFIISDIHRITPRTDGIFKEGRKILLLKALNFPRNGHLLSEMVGLIFGYIFIQIENHASIIGLQSLVLNRYSDAKSFGVNRCVDEL